jgi:hypothetical protein
MSQKVHQTGCPFHSASRRDFLAVGAAIGTGLMLPVVAEANSIQQLSGTVFVNRRYANAGTAINPGDTVTVAHGGMVSFTVGQDAYLLRGGTTMKIESDDNVMVNALRLFTGGILGVFGHGEKMIHLSTATIGIRGTGLYIDNAPDKTYFCTCYGETELRVDGVKSRILTATHHNAVMIYTPQSGKNKIHNMAGFEYHTDDELRATEALQGRKVPFDS